MKGKVVLLPIEWNDPGVPPDKEGVDVIVKCVDSINTFYTVAHMWFGEWSISYCDNTSFGDTTEIVGWAHLIAQ